MPSNRPKLNDIIRQREPQIIKRWVDRLLDTYPDDASRLMRSQKDQFANPVGHTLKNSLLDVFHEIVFSEDNEKLAQCLDRIIRIRAVQDFSPAAALAFIFDLKGVLREDLGVELREPGLPEELGLLDARIDEAMLIAFNVYSRCRDELGELRINEVKRNVSRLLQRANMLVDTTPGESEQIQ